jgi:hypothetical protein
MKNLDSIPKSFRSILKSVSGANKTVPITFNELEAPKGLSDFSLAIESSFEKPHNVYGRLIVLHNLPKDIHDTLTTQIVFYYSTANQEICDNDQVGEEVLKRMNQILPEHLSLTFTKIINTNLTSPNVQTKLEFRGSYFTAHDNLREDIVVFAKLLTYFNSEVYHSRSTLK